ncbi:hypothetical protein Tco_0393185, partial [Tanacetum coccineum]
RTSQGTVSGRQFLWGVGLPKGNGGMQRFPRAERRLALECKGRRAFYLHAALLRQAFAHCGKFPTAASRSGYQQKGRKPSQNDKTEHGMEKTVQNQGQSPKMSKSESILMNQQSNRSRN